MEFWYSDMQVGMKKKILSACSPPGRCVYLEANSLSPSQQILYL